MITIETSGRKVTDILAFVNAGLHEAGVPADEHNFSSNHWQQTNLIWPKGRWIACYAVRGNSEGWYVHIAVIDHEGKGHDLLALAKCWSPELALTIANKAAELLDAI
jgi:hypothetical protein